MQPQTPKPQNPMLQTNDEYLIMGLISSGQIDVEIPVSVISLEIVSFNEGLDSFLDHLRLRQEHADLLDHVFD